MKNVKSIIGAAIAAIIILAGPAVLKAEDNQTGNNIYDQIKQVEDALKKVKQAEATVLTGRLGKRAAVTYCMIGEEYRKEGQYLEAQQQFAIALNLYPDYKRAQKGLVKVTKALRKISREAIAAN